jgi:hypothetical protein
MRGRQVPGVRIPPGAPAIPVGRARPADEGHHELAIAPADASPRKVPSVASVGDAVSAVSTRAPAAPEEADVSTYRARSRGGTWTEQTTPGPVLAESGTRVPIGRRSAGESDEPSSPWTIGARRLDRDGRSARAAFWSDTGRCRSRSAPTRFRGWRRVPAAARASRPRPARRTRTPPRPPVLVRCGAHECRRPGARAGSRSPRWPGIRAEGSPDDEHKRIQVERTPLTPNRRGSDLVPIGSGPHLDVRRRSGGGSPRIVVCRPSIRGSGGPSRRAFGLSLTYPSG